MFQGYRQERVSLSCVSLAEADEFQLIGKELLLAQSFSELRRRAAFVAGRQAAAILMRQLGVSRQEILLGQAKEPIFPEGTLGSIAHCPEFAVCVMAQATDLSALGVDVENLTREFSRDISSRISVGGEEAWIKETDSRRRQIMLFSAKEAIYKALYPICQRFFGFSAVELFWHEGKSKFTAKLLEELSAELPLGFTFEVEVLIEGDYVLSLVSLTNHHL